MTPRKFRGAENEKKTHACDMEVDLGVVCYWAACCTAKRAKNVLDLTERRQTSLTEVLHKKKGSSSIVATRSQDD